MNRLYILALFALLTSCLGYKELPVEYDYSYRGNFKKYRTYDLMKPIGLSDTTMFNDAVEKSIISRMKFLGYKQSDHRPHLIVAYKMFPDSLTFNGYKQPEIDEWVKSRDTDLNYDKQKFNLKSGTLLIQFFDRRQNRAIWQGYATTMYGSIDFNNSRHMRNAVISILDKYRFWAEGFVEGQTPPMETELE
ncbi:MAG: hypothetical protein DI538_16870 [Azospira oryzae]|jgi:hypothetical protein|nr:hypothetical protein [Cytophaga sp.]PZR34257.1 MAG: hypothetical protein DI538_16870 [Azospira oryzae]